MSALILLSKFRETEIEIWRPVLGYPDYEVSNLGRLRSFRNARKPPPIRDRGRKRRPFVLMNPNQSRTGDGYPTVSLFRAGSTRGRTTVVHRLVAQAFVPNPEGKPYVNHKNGFKSDGRADNLEWSTFRDNRQHAVAHGMYPHGEKHGMAILREADVKAIRALAAEGQTIRQIRHNFPQVTWATVYAVVKGLVWRHVT